jgi:hypothetical protein
MFFIEAKKQIEASPDKDGLKDGKLLISEGDPSPTRLAAAKARRDRTKRTKKPANQNL